MNDIGGNVCIRDGEDGDYCWREAVESLLPICDTVTICDGGSTDGTLEAIQEWMTREPKIRLVHFPWDNPKGEFHFWVRWLNYARERVPNYWHLQLDADEVLSEKSYDWILEFTRRKRVKSANGHRLNFWRDPQHLVPVGQKCGHRVIRLAPQALWLPTDYPHPMGVLAMSIAEESPMMIFHYGMLRKKEGMLKKERRFQEWVFGSVDPRIEKAAEAPNYNESIAEQCGWIDQVTPYRGEHPPVARKWLTDRGYSL